MTSIVFKFLGITGSLIVCGSVIPQVIRTYKTKSAHDLSITSLSTLMTGLIMLMAYSVYIRNLVFIFENTLSILAVGILMGLWKRYRCRGYRTKGIRSYQEVHLWPTRRN